MLWFGPVGELPPKVNGSLVMEPDSDVVRQSTELSLLSAGMEYEIPLWMTPSNDLSFIGAVKLASLETNAVLPDSGVSLPTKFWDIRFGPAYRYKFKNNYVFGLALEAGSASDEPFAHYDDLTLMSNAFLRIPVKGRDAWFFVINYMNNREYLPHIPLPMGGYFLNRRPIRAFFGVPMWMNILPEKRVSFELFYAPIAVIKANMRTKLSKSASLITGFDWNNYRYFRDGRLDKKNRLFYYEKRLYGGLEVVPDRRVKASFRLGYAFDRTMFESRSFLDRDRNRIDVNDGPYARLDLKIVFASKKELNKYRARRR